MWEQLIIQPMTNLLLFIYDLLGHGPHTFGLAIILFTIVVRLITWPLNSSQVKGAQAMQELQNDKEWQEIQKTDPIPDHHWFVSKHHPRVICHAIGYA